jgi:hypothetical protein
VLRKRVAVLVAAAVMVLSMLAAAPVFAQGTGGCDPQPGQTEKARGDPSTPPQGHPGAVHSDNLQSEGATGFGDRVEECSA